MTASVADGASVEREGGRPDRRQAVKQRGEQLGRRDTPVAGDVAPIVDQVAGTRSRAREQIRAIGERLPEPAQQHAALFQSDQRIFGIDLKMSHKRRSEDACSLKATNSPWNIGSGRCPSHWTPLESHDGTTF